jgi:hypothetical protein
MSGLPVTVLLTRVFLVLDSLLWLGFAVVTAAASHPSYGAAYGWRWPMAVMALLVAGALAGLAVWLGRRSRAAFWIAVVLLAAMILASVFDQFGLADLAFVVVTLIPLILLIRDRAWYLRAPGVAAVHQSG